MATGPATAGAVVGQAVASGADADPGNDLPLGVTVGFSVAGAAATVAGVALLPAATAANEELARVYNEALRNDPAGP